MSGEEQSDSACAPGHVTHAHFPSTWSDHSIIQLEPPKESDITDRSLHERAGRAAFDPDGFRSNMGLRRSLYYNSGYLTCRECNGITFIDSTTLRTFLKLKHLVDLRDIPPESLPTCVGCGETGGLRVGAHDFLRLIEGGKEELARRRRLERAAVKVLQRAFRRYLEVRWRLAEAARQRTVFLLEYRSAQSIQAMLRGRLGRRVFETEKCLLVLKKANALLIKYALNNYPNRKKVFWYRTRDEEEQLYSNYLLLLERTGYRPPRMIVEENIREIAARVLERERELAARIQARWRGVSVRRYLRVFRREIRRRREIRAGMVLYIQRNVRGWIHRKMTMHRRSVRAGETVRQDYLALRDTQRGTGGKAKLLRAYNIERQEELTARLMGRTMPKLASGRKMQAFFDSPYGNDVVARLIRDQVLSAMQRENKKAREELDRKRRAEWVRRRQLDDPQLAMYFKGEMMARSAHVMQQLHGIGSAVGKIASVLRHHNATGGRKFDFPSDINSRETVATLLSEHHATDGQTLLKRFSHHAAEEHTTTS